MTYKSQFRVWNRFLVLALLAWFFLSASFACAEGSPPAAMLDIGPVVNSKMKQVTVGANPEHEEEACEIRAIHMAGALPDGFVPNEVNTVSSFGSRFPIYIFFDNKNDAGIMNFYTEGSAISMNPFSAYLFSGLGSLADISGVAGWDTSNVKDMCSLFSGAKSLPDALALRNWDTSGVTDMSYMFSEAVSLMFIDVSNWNTGNVTDMTCMFQVGESWAGNGQLREINGLGDLDVSNVTDMTCMFYGAGQMTYYDISRWDVSKVESMNHMFCDNRSLVSLDLSKWDVSSLKTIHCMFDDCYAIKTIGDVSHWNTVNLVDAGAWFNFTNAFVGDNTGTLDLSGWDTRNLKSVSEMFVGTKLHTIDLSGWTFDSITNERWEGAGRGIYYETGNDTETLCGFGQMFRGSPYLKTVYVSQDGLDSFNKAVENGANTTDMWLNTQADEFTVK